MRRFSYQLPKITIYRLVILDGRCVLHIKSSCQVQLKQYIVQLFARKLLKNHNLEILSGKIPDKNS